MESASLPQAGKLVFESEGLNEWVFIRFRRIYCDAPVVVLTAGVHALVARVGEGTHEGIRALLGGVRGKKAIQNWIAMPEPE